MAAAELFLENLRTDGHLQEFARLWVQAGVNSDRYQVKPSDSDEVRQLKMELANKNTELEKKELENYKLRMKVEDIDWYKWFGQWVGRIGHVVFDIGLLDAIQSVFRNELLMKSMARTVVSVVGSDASIVSCSVLAVVIAFCVARWLCKTECKQQKLKTLVHGICDGFTNFYGDTCDRMGGLYDGILKLINDWISKQALKY